ncbi:hypothetical protein LTR91_017527 [Friedmanniomyces endolithicus]|uniref:Major facilitator superfamily (MFS) profile domain-containing protein n=1 Tax=Friedmanniomyces endolithicus TaxID=329885 RepID=A0AAN6K5Z4_9PEZI|nr:hypothetical protein LTR35_004695 [Friedmanniomyces endolithicus]KAK0299161.1 hypothetical protein LTS00_002271 [Friedmanniomyces endolithicus]KAK0921882.1 hypothetical protein LTR57_008245 [Friedmanniomyces endolithicus]KAK0966531.1 hypothetical protein LTR91_017527 [Friedmanniomyces endolithicus]KAK1016917.1 hypothetical protein LTR54_002958 [Friedmanniomyces endolithicus]
MYSNEVRGVAVACFSATIFCGPFMGPFIGGFITNSYLGWRWTAYIPALMGFSACILAFFFQRESYGPVILVEKAANLRRLTRNWGIHAKQDEVEVDLGELLKKNLSRPIRILFTEPIILLVTIYLSFIYGLLYLNLTAYGLVFGQVYGWAPGVNGLPYFGLIIGVFIGFLSILATQPGYVKKLKANNNVPVPEWRLPLTMVGGIVFACGLFWFGWGGYKASTPWIVPTLAGVFLGFGIYVVFLCCLNYIIDAYLMFAASAIAANTIMRSLCGAIFPLFAYYMFEGIGIQWGMTLLGCLATMFIPMPFVFYFYGKKIRAKSKFAPAPDIQQDKRRDEEARMGGDAGLNGGSPDGQAAASGSSQSEETEKARKEEIGFRFLMSTWHRLSSGIGHCVYGPSLGSFGDASESQFRLRGPPRASKPQKRAIPIAGQHGTAQQSSRSSSARLAIFWRNQTAIKTMGLFRTTFAIAGYGSLATAASWLLMTRQCTMRDIPRSDYLFNHTLYARYNPNNAPVTQDICVRQVPLKKIRPELLEGREDGRLVDAFCQGVWGGVGYAYQRRFLEKKYRGPETAGQLWDRKDLSMSRYQVGTQITDHFEVVSRTPSSIIVRCGDSPRKMEVRESDGLFEMVVEVKEREGIAEFGLKSVFYNGLAMPGPDKDGKMPPEPMGPWVQWLHGQYDKLLMETSLRGKVLR